jgi:hypothetical protein
MRQKLTALTAAVLVATACGDDSDESDKGGAFIGTWTTTAATQSVIDCQFANKKENVAITYTVAKGDGADLKITSDAGGDCALKANVVGTRALVLENQTCERTEDQFKDTYKYATTSVIDMAADGTATIQLEATFKRATLDGLDTGYECGFTEEAPIHKN